MSRARRIRRQSEKHFNVLADLLMGFYAFLESSPKPSDEQVREEFKQRDAKWRRYCTKHHLNDDAASMFNREVAVSWKTRYAKQTSAPMTQS